MDYRERWELKEYLLEQRLGRRVTLFHVGVFVLLAGYLLCFWYLQGIRGTEYRQLAETNRLRRVPLLPTRGVIYDRDGEVIASTRPSLRLVLNRESPHDSEMQLRRLESILEVPYERLTRRVERMSGRPSFEPAVLEEDLELADLAPIEARRERFPSMEVQQASRRVYPFGEVVAHVLGHVGEVSGRELERGRDGAGLRRGDIVGKSGIERVFDDELRGTRGWKFVTVNNLGRELGDGRPGRLPEDGRSLRLTLDLDLQRSLLAALGEESGAGVFMDPRNGEILAMASSPTYDPNVLSGGISPESWAAIVEDPRRPLHDRTIAAYYAPGSSFKIVVAAAGLETGVISASTTVRCTGGTRMYGRRFLCWKRGGHGVVDLHDALVHSCNVYFYRLGKELGIDAIERYGRLFGLGQPTGVGLPGEAAGVLPSREWKLRTHGEPWYPGETISVSIGQGLLAVTPVQMATAMSALACRGRLPRPHLCASEEPRPRSLPIEARTFGAIRAALEDVVAEGTGRRAALDSIRVAGKTGTAQLHKRSAGVPSEDLPKAERDHAWFVGYAPAEDPRIAFAVVVEHGGHGGSAAAPVARRVLEAFFSRPGPRPDDRLRAGGSVRHEEIDARSASSR